MKYQLYCSYCGWEHILKSEESEFFEAINIHFETCSFRVEIRRFERCPIIIKVGGDEYQCILYAEHEDDHEINLLERRRLSVVLQNAHD